VTGKKTILLVDDDEDLREALAEQFDLHDGFDTLQAANAHEGITHALAERIDLILLDVDMPEMAAKPANRCGRKASARRSSC